MYDYLIFGLLITLTCGTSQKLLTYTCRSKMLNDNIIVALQDFLSVQYSRWQVLGANNLTAAQYV